MKPKTAKTGTLLNQMCPLKKRPLGIGLAMLMALTQVQPAFALRNMQRVESGLEELEQAIAPGSGRWNDVVRGTADFDLKRVSIEGTGLGRAVMVSYGQRKEPLKVVSIEEEERQKRGRSVLRVTREISGDLIGYLGQKRDWDQQEVLKFLKVRLEWHGFPVKEEERYQVIEDGIEKEWGRLRRILQKAIEAEKATDRRWEAENLALELAPLIDPTVADDVQAEILAGESLALVPVGWSEGFSQAVEARQRTGQKVTAVVLGEHAAGLGAELALPGTELLTVVAPRLKAGRWYMAVEWTNDPQIDELIKKGGYKEALTKALGKELVSPESWRDSRMESVLRQRLEYARQERRDEEEEASRAPSRAARIPLKTVAILGGLAGVLLGLAYWNHSPSDSSDADGVTGINPDAAGTDAAQVAPEVFGLPLDVPVDPDDSVPPLDEPPAATPLVETPPAEPPPALEPVTPAPVATVDAQPAVDEPPATEGSPAAVVDRAPSTAPAKQPVSYAKQLTAYFAQIAPASLPKAAQPVFHLTGEMKVDGRIGKQNGRMVDADMKVTPEEPMVVESQGRGWWVPSGRQTGVRMQGNGTSVGAVGSISLAGSVKGADGLVDYLSRQIKASTTPDGYKFEGTGKIFVGGTVAELTIIPVDEPLRLVGQDGQVVVSPQHRLTLDIQSGKTAIDWEKSDITKPSATAGPGPGGPPPPATPEQNAASPEPAEPAVAAAGQPSSANADQIVPTPKQPFSQSGFRYHFDSAQKLNHYINQILPQGMGTGRIPRFSFQGKAVADGTVSYGTGGKIIASDLTVNCDQGAVVQTNESRWSFPKGSKIHLHMDPRVNPDSLPGYRILETADQVYDYLDSLGADRNQLKRHRLMDLQFEGQVAVSVKKMPGRHPNSPQRRVFITPVHGDMTFTFMDPAGERYHIVVPYLETLPFDVNMVYSYSLGMAADSPAFHHPLQQQHNRGYVAIEGYGVVSKVRPPLNHDKDYGRQIRAQIDSIKAVSVRGGSQIEIAHTLLNEQELSKYLRQLGDQDGKVDGVDLSMGGAVAVGGSQLPGGQTELTLVALSEHHPMEVTSADRIYTVGPNEPLKIIVNHRGAGSSRIAPDQQFSSFRPIGTPATEPSVTTVPAAAGSGPGGHPSPIPEQKNVAPELSESVVAPAGQPSAVSSDQVVSTGPSDRPAEPLVEPAKLEAKPPAVASPEADVPQPAPMLGPLSGDQTLDLSAMKPGSLPGYQTLSSPEQVYDYLDSLGADRHLLVERKLADLNFKGPVAIKSERIPGHHALSPHRRVFIVPLHDTMTFTYWDPAEEQHKIAVPHLLPLAFDVNVVYSSVLKLASDGPSLGYPLQLQDLMPLQDGHGYISLGDYGQVSQTGPPTGLFTQLSTTLPPSVCAVSDEVIAQMRLHPSVAQHLQWVVIPDGYVNRAAPAKKWKLDQFAKAVLQIGPVPVERVPFLQLAADQQANDLLKKKVLKNVDSLRDHLQGGTVVLRFDPTWTSAFGVMFLDSTGRVARVSNYLTSEPDATASRPSLRPVDRRDTVFPPAVKAPASDAGPLDLDRIKLDQLAGYQTVQSPQGLIDYLVARAAHSQESVRQNLENRTFSGLNFEGTAAVRVIEISKTAGKIIEIVPLQGDMKFTDGGTPVVARHLVPFRYVITPAGQVKQTVVQGDGNKIGTILPNKVVPVSDTELVRLGLHPRFADSLSRAHWVVLPDGRLSLQIGPLQIERLDTPPILNDPDADKIFRRQLVETPVSTVDGTPGIAPLGRGTVTLRVNPEDSAGQAVVFWNLPLGKFSKGQLVKQETVPFPKGAIPAVAAAPPAAQPASAGTPISGGQMTSAGIRQIRRIEANQLTLQQEYTLPKERQLIDAVTTAEQLVDHRAMAPSDLERAMVDFQGIPGLRSQREVIENLKRFLLMETDERAQLWQDHMAAMLRWVVDEQRRQKAEFAYFDQQVERLKEIYRRLPKKHITELENKMGIVHDEHRAALHRQKAQLRLKQLNELVLLYQELDRIGIRPPLLYKNSPLRGVRDFVEKVPPPIKFTPRLSGQELEDALDFVRDRSSAALQIEIELLSIEIKERAYLYEATLALREKEAAADADVASAMRLRHQIGVLEAQKAVLEAQKDLMVAPEDQRSHYKKLLDEAVEAEEKALVQAAEYAKTYAAYELQSAKIHSHGLFEEKPWEAQAGFNLNLARQLPIKREVQRKINQLFSELGLPRPLAETTTPPPSPYDSPSLLNRSESFNINITPNKKPAGVPSGTVKPLFGSQEGSQGPGVVNFQGLASPPDSIGLDQPVTPVELNRILDEMVKQKKESNQSQINALQERIKRVREQAWGTEQVYKLDAAALVNWQDAQDALGIARVWEAQIEILQADNALIDAETAENEKRYHDAINQRVTLERERVRKRLAVLEQRQRTYASVSPKVTTGGQDQGLADEIERTRNHLAQLDGQLDWNRVMQENGQPIGLPEAPEAADPNPEMIDLLYEDALGPRSPSGYVWVYEDGKWRLKFVPSGGRVWIGHPIIRQDRLGRNSIRFERVPDSMRQPGQKEYFPTRTAELWGDFAEFIPPQDPKSKGSIQVILSGPVLNRDMADDYFYVPGGIGGKPEQIGYWLTSLEVPEGALPPGVIAYPQYGVADGEVMPIRVLLRVVSREEYDDWLKGAAVLTPVEQEDGRPVYEDAVLLDLGRSPIGGPVELGQLFPLVSQPQLGGQTRIIDPTASPEKDRKTERSSWVANLSMGYSPADPAFHADPRYEEWQRMWEQIRVVGSRDPSGKVKWTIVPKTQVTAHAQPSIGSTGGGGLEEAEQVQRIVADKMVPWIDQQVRRYPYGYGRLAGRGILKISVREGPEEQWYYDVEMEVDRETDSQGLFTEGYTCSDAAFSIAQRIKDLLAEEGIQRAQVRIKDGRTDVWSSDFFVEVTAGDRSWVLSATAGMPTEGAQFQEIHADYAPSQWKQFHRPHGFPVHVGGAGATVVPMFWIPEGEKHAILVSAGVDPGDGRAGGVYKAPAWEGRDRPFRLLYQISVVDAEEQKEVYQRSLAVAIDKHQLREIRNAIQPEQREQVQQRFSELGLTIAEHSSGELPQPMIEPVNRAFEQNIGLLYDFLEALREWPNEWDEVPAAGLEETGAVTAAAAAMNEAEARETVERLAAKWGLADMEQTRVVAVSPELLRTDPGWAALFGRRYAVGKVELVLLPPQENWDSDWAAGLVASYIGRSAGLEEYGSDTDPVLSLFHQIAVVDGGLDYVGRHTIEGQPFLAVLRQILANLAGLEEEAVSAEEAAAFAHALGLRA